MKRTLVALTIITGLLLASLVWLAAQENGTSPSSAQEKRTTLANLQVAYNGESNAQIKYLVFAKKAEAEGYLKVASLFRAAAVAESVHAASHAAVIRKLGVEPKKEIKPTEAAGTAENLKAAIAGETYEKDTMYPAFIAQARAEKNDDAVKTFRYALGAEGSHAKLYQEALDNLDQWKTAGNFYVCSICGYTVPKITFENCPSCGQPKEKYLTVS